MSAEEGSFTDRAIVSFMRDGVVVVFVALWLVALAEELECEAGAGASVAGLGWVLRSMMAA